MCSLTAASTTLWSVSTLGTLCHFCGQCLVPGQQGELVGRWEACALWGPGAGTQRFVKTVSWLFCTSPSTHSQPCSVPWGLTLQLPPWPPSPTASVDLKGGQSVSRAPWPLLQGGRLAVAVHQCPWFLLGNPLLQLELPSAPGQVPGKALRGPVLRRGQLPTVASPWVP